MTVRVNNDGVAVDQDYFWRPMESCPLSTKVQLLTLTGVAVYGAGSRNNLSYLAWAPLPRVPDWLRQRQDVLNSRPSVQPHGY